MFVTSIAYDYFKGFCTAFIEINGQPETIFGKPPVKYIVPVVNLLCAFEGFMFFLFTTFLMIKLANGDSLFAVFAPMYLYWTCMLIGMIALYIHFTICMFRYAKSRFWIFCFFILLPLGFINVLLFFGSPLLVSIVVPIQWDTDLWQSPTAWDSTIYIVMGLAGGLLKGFVRPTEDEENPYSTHTWSLPITIAYFFFFFTLVVFLFLLTCQIDGQLPYFLSSEKIPFEANWWLVWLPALVGQLVGFIVFTVRAVQEWRLVIKKDDPNGDGLYRAVFFSGLMLFLILIFIAQMLVIIDLNDPNLGLITPLTILPLPLAYLVIIVLSIIPFITFFQRRVSAEDKSSREMLCPL